MGDRDRNEGGEFEPEHTDKDILQVVEDNEPAGTQEVADQLGIARQSADYRLRKLHEEGRVNKKRIGNSLAWFLKDTE